MIWPLTTFLTSSNAILKNALAVLRRIGQICFCLIQLFLLGGILNPLPPPSLPLHLGIQIPVYILLLQKPSLMSQSKLAPNHYPVILFCSLPVHLFVYLSASHTRKTVALPICSITRA